MGDMPSIFMGYRRSDSADAAGRIFDRLEAVFGEGHVFKDVDAMPLGVDFRTQVTGIIRDIHIFLILIGPNQNLYRFTTDRTTFAEAFHLADDVLYTAIRSVIDLAVAPGLINLDFEDLIAFFNRFGRGKIGFASYAKDSEPGMAVEEALDFGLTGTPGLASASRILVNVTGGYDLSLFDIDQIAMRVRTLAPAQSATILGSTFDPDLEGKVSISVWANEAD